MSRMPHTRGHPRRNQSRRWVLGLVALTGVLIASVLVTMAVVAANGGMAAPSPTSDKLSQISGQVHAAASSPHAPKSPRSTTNVSACPRGTIHPGLFTGDNGGFHAHILNEAVIAPSASYPFEYIVFAGASSTNPQQGLLIVVRLDMDPCAVTATGTQVAYYNVPMSQGAITLSAIAGTTVSFTGSRGVAGRFDYTTGSFN
ncbi:MAG TPA: hypothetical protein VGN32_13785 [Ktedonobacterales bacterium]|nr:hypothetical protein [Ktedonobacterales bacterium]